MKAVLLTDGQRDTLRKEVERLRPRVEKRCDVVGLVDDLTGGTIPPEAEVAIVFGGDGSILRTAHLMGRHQLPVLGVNLGRLGFLARVQPEGLDEVLGIVCAGRHCVDEHLMFQWQLQRDGAAALHGLGLNEAAVLAGPPFAMLEVQLYVDAELVTTYSADGLIVSTPVGSTAHSLSAGGPILRSNLQAFVISPISPHTLTNRPVVDAADRVFEVVATNPNEGTSLVVDGRVMGRLLPGDRVRIARGEDTFKLIEIPGRSYYRTLREKLGWGGQLTSRKPGA